MVCPIIARAQGIQADLVFGLLKGNSNGPWVALSSKEVVKPGDWLKITLTPPVSGYLYAVEVLPDRVVLLSSGKWDGQFVEARKTVAFPELGFQPPIDNNPVPPISVLLAGTRLSERKVREILHLPVESLAFNRIAKPRAAPAPPDAPGNPPRAPIPTEAEPRDPIWDESKRVATVTVKPEQYQITTGGNQAGSQSNDSSSQKLGQREYLFVNLSPILKFLVSGGK